MTTDHPTDPFAGQWQDVRTVLATPTPIQEATNSAPTTAIPEPEPEHQPVNDDHTTAPAPADTYQQQHIDYHQNRVATAEARLDAYTTAHQPHAPAPRHTDDEKPQKPSLIDKYGPWVALYAAIGLTASGEYALAVLAGWPGQIAWLLPTAIDVYVTVALRRGRDMAPALILMVVANALYHLADKRLFGTDETGAPLWWLIVGVAAIAPLVMWRVHRMSHAAKPAPATPQQAPATVSETVAHPAPATPHTAETAVAATPRRAAIAASATPRETVRATLPAATEPVAPARETAPAAKRETASGQRETATATPRATRPATAPSRRKTTRTATPATPSKLLPKDEQMEIVKRIVAQHDGDGDVPLQPIADALGCSKATASRRLAELKQSA